MSKPPKAYRRFVERYPQLGQAWETIGEAGKEGPLDECTCRSACPLRLLLLPGLTTS